MPGHAEISTTYFPEIIVDQTLHALDISNGLKFRRTGLPVSRAENERCVNAILMIFISFEGYFNRLIYLLVNDQLTSAHYLQLKLEKFPEKRLEGLLNQSVSCSKTVDRFKEALVLRNALSHGHLYETTRSLTRRVSVINRFILDDTNRSYINYVNLNSYRTLNLRLRVIPSEVGISDLYQILKLWNLVYRKLNTIHGNKASLQGYIFPDYSAYLRSLGRTDELRELEDRLIGRDDGSFKHLLWLFDNKER